MRKTPFAKGEYYHVYNRGTDKRNIFIDQLDLNRFWESILNFNQTEPIGSMFEYSFRKANAKVKPLVQFVSYCINPNHFHFLITPIQDKGIEKFMQKLGNGYTKYFNNKYKRSGVLFQGKFKSKHVGSNEYLLHLSAYINSNDKLWKQKQLGHRMSKLCKSSLYDFIGKVNRISICKTDIILGQFRTKKEYQDFVESSLEDIELRKEMLKELE